MLDPYKNQTLTKKLGNFSVFVAARIDWSHSVC